MKIGIDVSALSSKSTGTGRYIRCLLEQMEKFDVEIKLFPSDKEFYENRNRNPFRKKYEGLKRNYNRLFSLTNQMMNANIDCGIFPDYFIPLNFYKPSAIVIHDLSFITHPQFYSSSFVFYYKYLLKETLKKNPLILTVSEHTKENISRYLDINKESILLVQAYTKVKSPLRFTERQSKAESPYFLYVGHIEPRKNLLFMVDNFLKWKEESGNNFKLKIIGETWIKSKEIEELLRKYSMHPDIIFRGYVDEDELEQSYKNAFAFIHTSLEEGFGFPILEAMHYGLPVLCSNNHAAKEISSPNSITFDPQDNDSFINGLNQIFEMKTGDSTPEYRTKYSPDLMHDQLSIALDILQTRAGKKIYSLEKSKFHEEAIEKTLLYSHLFNGGLHKKDLYNYLFDVKVNKDEFEEALNKLLGLNKINFTNDNITLNYKNLKIYRNEAKPLSEQRIIFSLKLIKRIPFISCINFSGGTANYGIKNHNDIDLFIITKPNSVYIVYSMIHILSKIFNVRKFLCANFLLDEEELEIKDHHDYYTAHQIVSLTPFKNPQMLNYFRQKNYWAKNFFPNFMGMILEDKIILKESNPLYRFLKPFNRLLKHFYRLLYKKHLKKNVSGSITLNNNSIKLYTNDHRTKILEAFFREWKEYLELKSLNLINEIKVKSELVEASEADPQ